MSRKTMLWSTVGILALMAIIDIFSEQDETPPSATDTAMEQSVENTSTSNAATGTAPLAELSLTDYRTHCQGVPEADFNRDCLGKRVVWVLFLGLTQITQFWGYYGAYAQEPTQPL